MGTRPTSSHAPVIGRLAGMLLGAVLLFGTFGKVLDPIGFAELIELHGLDFLLPSSAVVFVALVLEVGIGAALVLGIRRLWVLVPAGLLVGLFLYLTGSDYLASLSGADASRACGCFGNLVERSPAQAFWQDLAMLVPTLGLAFVGRPAAGPPHAFGRIALGGLVTAGALVFAALAPDLPIDDFATRLEPGLALTDLCAGPEEDRTCFDAIDPMLMGGEYLVVIADVDDPAHDETLNAYAFGGAGPALLVVSSQSVDELEELRWSERSPRFQIVHAPLALIRPLYRTLPRSFRTVDGKVVETWSGLPPFERFATKR